MTIEEIVEQLKLDLEGQEATIKINFAGISKNILEKDIYGNSIQSWLHAYFVEKSIPFEVNKNTQTFPDFIVNGHDLEIKCFNFDATPAFDVAEPSSFLNTVYENPNKINAWYLIFGYSSTKNGFTISHVWLKKIWEITGPMPSRNDCVTLQMKGNMVHRIRPKVWYGKTNKTFRTKEEFILGIGKMIDESPSQFIKYNSNEWMKKISENS